ncbi:MAG: TonB-dependent receptor [Sphingomonas sp.]|nr:TonB-dependent receptor [Sphingomonas sp.]
MSFCLIFSSAIAQARTDLKSFVAIPRQALEKAIQQLALQKGRQVIFLPSRLTLQSSKPISGRLAFEDALKQLLAGTGLTFRQTANGITLVEPAKRDKTPSEDLPSYDDSSARAEIVVVGTPNTDLVSFLGDLQLHPKGVSLDGIVDNSVSASAQPGNSGQQAILVRGIGTAGEATTIVYFGDVAVTGPSGTGSDAARSTIDLAMVDIASIQISRTSRGTEHGVGALAGEIEIEPERPKMDTLEAIGTASLSLLDGGNPGLQLSGTLNAPLGPDAAIRLTSYGIRVGGYVDNIRTLDRNVNDDEMQGARAILRYTPATELDMSVMLQWQHRRIADTSLWTRSLGRYRTDRYFSAPTTHDFLLGRLRTQYDFSGIRLTSISAWYRWQLDRNYDRTNATLVQGQDPAACQRYFDLGDQPCDATQMDALEAHVATLTPTLQTLPIVLQRASQEIRFENVGTQGFLWKVGALVDRREEHFRSGLSIYSPDEQEPYDYFGLRQLSINRWQASLFGDWAYRGGSGLQASLGLRYDWHKVSSRNDVLVPNFLSGSAESWPLTIKQSRGIHAKAHIDVPIDQRLALHAQITRSFRPAGVNTAALLVEQLRTFKSDTLWGFEAGAQMRWSPQLSVTIVGYLNRWQDMQYRALQENFAHAYIVNVGTAVIGGGELEVVARPEPHTTIRLAGSLISSRVESVSESGPLGSGAKVGDPIPFTSTVRSRVSVSRKWALGSGRAISAKADMQYQSGYRSTFNREDPLFLATGSFTLFGAEIGYQSDKATFTAALTNIFNAQADLRALSNAFGVGQTLSARPRELSLTWKQQW